MFKAIDKVAEVEVVILAPGWAERLQELRALDREDLLVCQGCRHPVRVKAGSVLRWHFAHKQLRDCHYGRESPELLEARAALYGRLHAVFGDAVTLEKRLEDPRFPRPVDCWVETDAGILAYWIFDSQMRPEARDALKHAFAALKARVHWVFTTGMLRVDAEDETLVHLTTTERELVQKAWVDCDLRGTCLEEGESLYYVDGTEGTLTAYRGLHCVHEPQVYRGRCEEGPLAEVRVAPSTGELAHPRELERARRLWQEQRERKRAEQARRERQERERERREREAREAQEGAARLAREAQERAARAEREQQERELRREQMREEQERYEALERAREERQRRARLVREQSEKEIAERLAREGAAKVAPSPASRPDAGPAVPSPTTSVLTLTTQAGTCVFCGRRTTDWWKIDHGTKQCKCRDCLRQGRH